MRTPTTLTLADKATPFEGHDTLVFIGRAERLRSGVIREQVPVPAETWDAMLDRAEPGDAGASEATWVGTQKVVAAVLPEPCSRHNSASRAWAIPRLAAQADGSGENTVVLALDAAEHGMAAALAVARAFPLYGAKTKNSGGGSVRVHLVGPGGVDVDPRIAPAMDGVRLAARLFDTPTSEMHCDALVAECEAVAERTGATLTVIRGEELKDRGFGGLYSVGRAANTAPALVVLDHHPAGAETTVAWVGKGLVYDTGGLSIKTKGGMPGMKGDMGGCAAVLGAFQAAVESGVEHRLVALACIAENAIGPDATRPDDVITMWSGKTVEVNNTDAEGRLVLADGVAFAAAEYAPDLLVDAATLTGAALTVAGKIHACVMSNDEAVEQAAVKAGRDIGEPCHPMLYAPELLRREFKSSVADMKNSVKNRANAQASCAGQFIANHLPDPAPRWLHVDLAGPAWSEDENGTGYGVGLLLALGAGPKE